MWEQLYTIKSRKQREKEWEIHEICLPSSVQYWPSMGERAAIRSPITMSNFTKEIPKGYKNKSPNLILLKVPISFRDQETQS